MLKKLVKIFFYFMPLLVCSQVEEELYLFLENDYTINVFEGYKLYMNIESTNPRFSHDTYFFIIWKETPFKEKPLYELGQVINIDTINFIKKTDFGKNWVQTHEKLSAKKTIFIILMVPKKYSGNEKKTEYMMWPAHYIGTQKDFFHTKM